MMFNGRNKSLCCFYFDCSCKNVKYEMKYDTKQVIDLF